MWFDNQAEPSKFQGFGFQNWQNVTDTRKWLYAPNFRDMQPSMPMFAVVRHRKVVTKPVAMLSIVFYYPTNSRFNSRISLARSREYSYSQMGWSLDRFFYRSMTPSSVPRADSDLKSTYCFCAHMHEMMKYFSVYWDSRTMSESALGAELGVIDL